MAKVKPVKAGSAKSEKASDESEKPQGAATDRTESRQTRRIVLNRNGSRQTRRIVLNHSGSRQAR